MHSMYLKTNVYVPQEWSPR